MFYADKMKNKRMEFQFDEAGCMVMVAPLGLGGYEFKDLLWGVFSNKAAETVRQLVDRNALMPMSLYQDDGYIVRLVLDELGEREAEDWVARARWKLNIPCGKLLVTGVLDFEDEIPEANDGDEFYVGCCYAEVPPGDYQVEVYSYPPYDLSTGWGQVENPDLFEGKLEPEKPIDYFRRTRPNEEPPEWLDDENFNLENAYINFVVRLTSPQEGLPRPEFEGDGFIEWEFRKPEKFPLGVPSLAFKPQ
jgi:hypothetical protein